MKNRAFIIIIGTLCLFTNMHTQARTIQFEEEILPILQEKCWRCHSSRVKEPSAGLLLDTPKQLMSGNEYGPVITRMLPDESILVERIEIKPGKRGAMPPLAKEIPAHPNKSRSFANGSSKAQKPAIGKATKNQNKHISPKTSETTPLSAIKNMGKMIKIPG